MNFWRSYITLLFLFFVFLLQFPHLVGLIPLLVLCGCLSEPLSLEGSIHSNTQRGENKVLLTTLFMLVPYAGWGSVWQKGITVSGLHSLYKISFFEYGCWPQWHLWAGQVPTSFRCLSVCAHMGVKCLYQRHPSSASESGEANRETVLNSAVERVPNQPGTGPAALSVFRYCLAV
jgi:hypothetical protein